MNELSKMVLSGIEQRKMITNQERNEIISALQDDDMFFYDEVAQMLKVSKSAVKLQVFRKNIKVIIMKRKAILTGAQIKTMWPVI